MRTLSVGLPVEIRADNSVSTEQIGYHAVEKCCNPGIIFDNICCAFCTSRTYRRPFALRHGTLIAKPLDVKNKAKGIIFVRMVLLSTTGHLLG